MNPLSPIASALAAGPYQRSAWRRYGMAIVLALVGWGARELLTPVIGPSALPYIFFFPAVAACGWYGGRGPATGCALLAAAIANWAFVEPVRQFDLSRPAEFVALGAFFLSCGVIIASIEAMHGGRRRMTEARNLLSTTLSSIGDGVIVCDETGRVTLLNPEAERLTGWANSEATGQPMETVFRIVDEETRRPADDPAGKVLRSGTVLGLANHTLLLSRDGIETPIDDSAAPVRLPGGVVAGVVLVFRDVSAQRAGNRALSQLGAIVRQSGDAIFTKTIEGVIQTWNASAERLFGYTAEEAIGKPITMLIPPDRLEEEPRILARLRSGQPVERMETVRVAKDGRRIPVALSVSPLRDADGRIVGASKIVHDITEVLAAREALDRERQLLQTTLASIGDAVIVTDVEGRVSFMNREAERLTRWTQAEAKGRELPVVFRILSAATRQPVENPVEKVLRSGGVVGLANHTILVAKDGTEVPIDDSAAPIRHGDQPSSGVVLVFRDITVRRRAEETLREGERRKDQFLATLSHELRNPLAPIRLAVTMLRTAGPPDGQVQELRAIIDRQSSQMGKLLDDLLDVSRITSGKIALQRVRVSLRVVLTAAIEVSRPIIESQGHELVVRMPAGPIDVQADVSRLAQVFSNLLNNAAKYTERGGHITLEATREDGEAVVRITDDGIGLESSQLRRIFDMFSQVDTSLERRRGGLGVGLSLAKELVEMHGGRIEASSDGLGKGSRFTVRLPVRSATTTAAPALLPAPRPADRPAPRRVLVADDNEDSAAMLALTLRRSGHEVRVVHDGQAVLEVVESFRPEVAILDIGMPKVNGYDVAKELRARYGAALRLIAVTGWGQEADRRRARESGFDEHLTKPVDFAAVEEAIAPRGAPRA